MKWLALVMILGVPALAQAQGQEPDSAAKPAPAAAAQHPAGVEKTTPMGVIQGGWGYVYAAYGAGLLGLVTFAASLFLRRNAEQPPGAS